MITTATTVACAQMGRAFATHPSQVTIARFRLAIQSVVNTGDV